jgi:hypothetical protein
MPLSFPLFAGYSRPADPACAAHPQPTRPAHRRLGPQPTAWLAGLLTVAAAMLSPPPVLAQEMRVVDTRPFRFITSVGLTGGGDKLATAYYWYRDDYTIRAGSLLQANVGVEFNLAPSLTGSLTLGYHFDGVSARNGDLYFSRWPIEAMVHASLAPNFRLGGGLRFPINPRLRGEGDAPDVDEDFKMPVGVIAEAEYRFNPTFGLKLRGVTERYKSKQGLPTVKGDHVGLFAAFYF